MVWVKFDYVHTHMSNLVDLLESVSNCAYYKKLTSNFDCQIDLSADSEFYRFVLQLPRKMSMKSWSQIISSRSSDIENLSMHGS